MTDIPERFPKVESPYHRAEDDDGNYVVDPEGRFIGIKKKFEWVFDRSKDVEAIEKLDGTNCAIYIDNGRVVNGATRMGNKQMNELLPFHRTNHHYVTRAIQNSVRRGYTDGLYNEYGSGWFFGEAIGPKIQGNPHGIDEHLFIPFDWVRHKLSYKSYGKYDTSEEAIRDWFRGEENGLFSLFASRIHGQDLDASRPANGTFIEGLMFIHPDFDGRIHPDHFTLGNDGQSVKEMVKLRRDMYSGHATDEWPMTEYGHN